MLAELYTVCGTRRRVAALLGCDILTLNAWTMGRRNPCRAARRAIWFAWCLLLHPEKLRTMGDLLTWGRVSEAHAREQGTCRHPGWDFEI